MGSCHTRIPKMILFWFQSNWIIMQQVPVSNIIMLMKSPKRSIVKNGLSISYNQAVLSARSSRQSVVPVGVWREMCWSQSAWMKSMTEWTHFSESRGLVGIRNWNDSVSKAQTLNSLCTDPPPLRKNRRKGPFSEGVGVVCTQANTKMTICPRHRH